MQKQRTIPKGWEECQISDIFDTTSGGTPLSTEKTYYDQGMIPWINSGELNAPYIREQELANDPEKRKIWENRQIKSIESDINIDDEEEK